MIIIFVNIVLIMMVDEFAKTKALGGYLLPCHVKKKKKS
jgi:hypothetical protein